MLPSINRLNKDKDFERVFKTGRSDYSSLLGVKSVKNDKDCLRGGILVGMKVSKKAVIRNLVKRRIREALRAELPNLKSGFDIVIIAFPPAAEAGHQEIGAALKACLFKSRLYS